MVQAPVHGGEGIRLVADCDMTQSSFCQIGLKQDLPTTTCSGAISNLSGRGDWHMLGGKGRGISSLGHMVTPCYDIIATASVLTVCQAQG